jgi:hypothetical protein
MPKVAGVFMAGLATPQGYRHVISRAHCAVSVYCWNITILPP